MQIQELGLGGSVKLPGFASNLPEEINKAAMYISTSNHEGISNSMLEALGMGIPTIVTDCPVGGSKMFVHTGDNGILISMNDKKQLVEAMTQIAEDDTFSQKISKRAIKIRDELQALTIAEKWLSIM
jgi:GalNAc-alpha-(1->4)-GalNAc-alpha-(1->3)-diNAcBac-PP-undecaprenol alpha-1,4-N-acetyl-D-galactosaminyltransferase